MHSAVQNFPVASIRASNSPGPRRFDFAQDTFAFPNELIWEYVCNPDTGKTTFQRRETKPSYAHRCFVLVRVAKQFFLHARFEPALPAPDDQTCRRLIRLVVSRDPWVASRETTKITFPGYSSLRELSVRREALLKAECGGAWRSYFMRSHWRMVFPFSRRHQERTAARLATTLRLGRVAIIHLVRFPRLSINHGMVLFNATEVAGAGMLLQAYDPNDSEQPTGVLFDRKTRTFFLPANSYWAGGRVDIVEICCRRFF